MTVARSSLDRVAARPTYGNSTPVHSTHPPLKHWPSSLLSFLPLLLQLTLSPSYTQPLDPQRSLHSQSPCKKAMFTISLALLHEHSRITRPSASPQPKVTKTACERTSSPPRPNHLPYHLTSTKIFFPRLTSTTSVHTKFIPSLSPSPGKHTPI